MKFEIVKREYNPQLGDMGRGTQVPMEEYPKIIGELLNRKYEPFVALHHSYDFPENEPEPIALKDESDNPTGWYWRGMVKTVGAKCFVCAIETQGDTLLMPPPAKPWFVVNPEIESVESVAVRSAHKANTPRPTLLQMLWRYLTYADRVKP